jgi:hypothetical protein
VAVFGHGGDGLYNAIGTGAATLLDISIFCQGGAGASPGNHPGGPGDPGLLVVRVVVTASVRR